MTREELHEIKQYVIDAAPEGLTAVYLERVACALEAAWMEIDTITTMNHNLEKDINQASNERYVKDAHIKRLTVQNFKLAVERDELLRSTLNSQRALGEDDAFTTR